MGAYRKFFSNFDYHLFSAMILLVFIGIGLIYSATYHSDSAIKDQYLKQVLWFSLGFVLLAAVVVIPINVFAVLSYGFYVLSVGLLILVLLVGRSVGGAERWFTLGFLQFQPSELAKVATVLALGRYLSQKGNLTDKKVIATSFLLGLVPMVLVIEQPNLGTALVFAVLPPALLFWAGVPPTILFLTLAPLMSLVSAFNYYSFLAVMLIITLVLYLSRRGIALSLFHLIFNISVGLVAPFLWQGLHPYQQRRILTFLGLISDPQGAGYQILQSQVALGSGGIFGKGFLHGTQTQLRFLPQQHTDFIFSVLGEEFGFLGALIVLVLFLVLILRSIRLASIAKSGFSRLVAIGIATIFLFHVFVNVGIASGLLPVAGLPLPFLSYGGSSLLCSMFMLGLLINIAVRRFEY